MSNPEERNFLPGIRNPVVFYHHMIVVPRNLLDEGYVLGSKINFIDPDVPGPTGIPPLVSKTTDKLDLFELPQFLIVLFLRFLI
ncbi:hypothetical protein NPIL_557631 [Nephila pilipes]|uniref:Uncharacterized protein n=1 Tax=Nephila pilipes TaxID=299642 RepID=A0A8X6P6F2_NEPPI|nr:hypothetical protein NPIL_557631 [Nephila pilipes]